MKKLLSLLILSCASGQAFAHSPELTQLLDEIALQYNNPQLAIAKRSLKDETKLPFFLQNIKENSEASLRLKAYLTGLQTAYFGSVNRQIDIGGSNWFCMRDTTALDPERNPDFVEQLIWKVLDKTAKNDPDKFRRSNYIGSFTVSIDYIVEYGLQTEYPCYTPIPKSLQLNGWKY
ncbi:hypothetical protein [Vibrio sinaloensis]|uniref:hypothetical protein n=1 Tax=Photobacterium sp. (strain ATCC 43367) TaxID=379097 RepID=UPI0035E63BDD